MFNMFFRMLWSVSYRLVHLPGHVRSEEGLHDESSSLLLPVACPLHNHPVVLLDGGGCLRATHELHEAEETRDKHVNMYFNI